MENSDSRRTLGEFRAEIWTLFSLGMAFTMLRVYARVRIVGFRHLEMDDYLAGLAMLFYAAETATSFYGGSQYYGSPVEGRGRLAPEMLAFLPPDDPRLDLWLTGQRVHFTTWYLYTATLWTLKASLLVLYLRLTTGLNGTYRIRILMGFGMLLVTWLVLFIVPFTACRPFNRYWSVNPVPSLECRPAVSRPIVWSTYTANVVTDIYLISIPVPMLWQTTMKTWKKVGLGILFSGGLLIIVFATVRAVLIVTDPINGAPVSGTWAVRETFVAIITANAPMAFTLVKGLLGPRFQSTNSGSRSLPPKGQKAVGSGSGGLQGSTIAMDTYGSSKFGRNRGGNGATLTNLIFSESEERMVYGPDDTPALSDRTLRAADEEAGTPPEMDRPPLVVHSEKS